MKKLTKYFLLGSILFVYGFFAWGISSTIIDQIWKLEDIKSIDGNCWESRSFPSWYISTGDFPIVFRGYMEMPTCFAINEDVTIGYINEHIQLSTAYLFSNLVTLILLTGLVSFFTYWIQKMKTQSNNKVITN